MLLSLKTILKTDFKIIFRLAIWVIVLTGLPLREANKENFVKQN